MTRIDKRPSQPFEREKNFIKLPHEDCFVRLRPSPLHGVGVFAIKDIPKGTDPFENIPDIMVEIPVTEIEKITGEDRQLYEDFCGFDGDKAWCPDHFEKMETSWYINSSKSPNSKFDYATNSFITLRDIKAGEELTADYDEYSDR